jgi:M3 family oligoendopeptidase
MSGIEFDFEGEKRNLGAMAPFMQSTDRNMRKKASETYYGALYAEKDDLDNIYHNLVQTRHKLALDQGYIDFVKMSYHRLLRYDYGPEEVAAFRELVQKHLIPISNKLRERQAKRIGVDKLKHYDEPLKFLEGNPTPKGSPEWILETGRQMYKELSPETHEFFESMVKADMMDLVNRNGKQGGGYCTYFPTYGSPFIFSNFNGTAHDVEVLTHEAGHAFQVYSSKDQPLNEYWWPTLESAEIHSMSMEFFTWPWMKNFFGEDTDRFMFDHIASSMTFIPYGCSIDHFQELVFRNPGDSPEERLERWKQVEKIYAPMKDNDGNPFLEEGRYWQRQGHVYRSPFYYIDYTLAQICAFQFWIKSREDFDAAWKDYLRLCRAGGSKPFLQLLDLANLDSPFEESTMLRVAEEVNAWLDGTSID